MSLTIGLVLAQAYDRGLIVDVDLTSGRRLQRMRISALEQYAVVLMPEGGGPDDDVHVIDRDHVAMVSLRGSDLLALEASPNQAAGF